jgi:hypothetical protein
LKIFQIDNFEPVPTEEFFLIEEFKALYALKYNDSPGDTQGRKRIRGNSEARYLYFLCDHRSEFAKFSEEERKTEALAAADLPENYKISDTLEAAIERYIKLNNSRNIRLLTSANAAVDKLAEYFRAVDFTKLDTTGKFQYDPKDLISNVGNLGKVIEGLEKLEEAVRKDEGQESSTRGSADKGRLS